MKKAIGYLILIGLVSLVATIYAIMYGFLTTIVCAVLIVLFVWLTVTAINLIS